jgi:hypothetical protein
MSKIRFTFSVAKILHVNLYVGRHLVMAAAVTRPQNEWSRSGGGGDQTNRLSESATLPPFPEKLRDLMEKVKNYPKIKEYRESKK